MKRRSFLGAASATSLTVAGCTSLRSVLDDGGSYLTVSVDEVDTWSNQWGSTEVEVVQQFTDSEPAFIRITLTNVSNTEHEKEFGGSPPFSGYWPRQTDRPVFPFLFPKTHNSHLPVLPESTDTDGTVTPVSEKLPDTPTNGCWRTPRFQPYFGSKLRTLSPGDSLSEEYAILYFSQSSKCLSSGKYRYDIENYLDGKSSWGFTLSFEDESPAGTPTGGNEDGPADRPSPTDSTTTATPSVRCRGEHVAADRSFTDKPGYEDDLQYFPSNSTVKVVTLRTDDGPAGFAKHSFDAWATSKAASVGIGRVRAVTAERLGTDVFSSGIGDPPDFAGTDATCILLTIDTQQSDNKTTTPTVSLSDLADAAPKAVDVTITLEGDAFSRLVPVFASYATIGFE